MIDLTDAKTFIPFEIWNKYWANFAGEYVDQTMFIANNPVISNLTHVFANVAFEYHSFLSAALNEN